MNDKKQILIIKLSALGDIIMSSTIVKAVRKNSPNAKITWLCGKKFYSLVKMIDGIDEIIACDSDKIISGSKFEKISSVADVWKKLFARKFDLCLIGNMDKRYKILSYSAVCKIRRSFEGRFAPTRGRWYGNEYGRLAEGLDSPLNENYPLADFKIDKTIFPRSENRILLSPSGCGSSVAATGFLRRWDIENYVKVAEFLIEKKFEVGLIGDSSDEHALPYFEHLPVTSYIGKLSIAETFSLLSSSRLLITHDCGPFHIGYAAGCQVLGIFGPVMAEERAPKLPNVSFIKSDFLCSPCYDGRYYASQCKDNLCMKSIKLAMVCWKIEEIFGTPQRFAMNMLRNC